MSYLKYKKKLHKCVNDNRMNNYNAWMNEWMNTVMNIWSNEWMNE